jgi:hypothetical protein
MNKNPSPDLLRNNIDMKAYSKFPFQKLQVSPFLDLFFYFFCVLRLIRILVYMHDK